MPNKATFISFDAENDEFLKIALVGQAKNPDSPFDIVDRSIKEPLDGNWKAKAKDRILRSDLMIVLCGVKTHTATGVAAEVSLAQETKTPYFLLRGYPDKLCTKPTTALSTDKVYDWTWTNLKNLIAGSR